ncbi:MAG: DUF3179 domain-containing (seleno)protein [Salinirussus sp.]
MTIEHVLPRDAIPSIDDPAFGDEYDGNDDDEVLVVDGDPPRAYPLRILCGHEIVNDVLGRAPRIGRSSRERGDVDAPGAEERPIAVTWCPICWSTAVYDRRVDGRTLTFGVSGKLADDALLMYDRETGSEWKQPTGRAVSGELADASLESVAAPITSWGRFEREHPDGIVLQPVRSGDGDGPFDERYDVERYERYAAGEGFGLHAIRGEGTPRSWDRDDLDAKTVVLGVELGGEAVGYPIPRVEAAGGVVTDTVGGTDVVVCTADDGIHAFEDPGLAYEHRDGVLVAGGTTWDPTTGESADGRRLARVPGRRLFAFSWQDAYGPDAFYSPGT